MIEKIAFYSGERSEEPNIRLAEKLVESRDCEGIAEIVDGLEDENPSIAGDCIKVLYEIAYRDPALVADRAETFVRCLNSRNNRLVWGAAIALSRIAGLRGDYLFSVFDTIHAAYRKGSVITVDHCISIFAGIAKSDPRFMERIFPIIIDHLENCRVKEIPQHAERAFVCIDEKNAGPFRDALMKRYEFMTVSQKKRIDALVKKIEKEEYD